MSAVRPTLRGSAVLCGLVLVAGVLSVAPTAQASAPAPATKPARAAAAAPSTSPARGVTVTPSAAQSNARYAPPLNYVPYLGPRFGYLKYGKRAQAVIRNQVLATIKSTWGGPLDRYGLPLSTNGKIRLATWSFGDMAVARALVAARNRGVSVQIMAANGINRTHREWGWLKKRLRSRYYNPNVPGSSERISFARDCRSSCRGRGGTPHSKFYLFDNVGANHARNITFQSSMNLTTFAFNGQWNSAQVSGDYRTWAQHMIIFREMRPATYNVSPYREYVNANGITNIFFPFPGARASNDPVMRQLNRITSCTGAGVYNGRTRIRVINFAIHQSRGEWIARKLRSLWQSGCDVAVIYGVTTRTVLNILRNRSGRGAIPMKQSVLRGSKGTIVKYNHSKWLAIGGHIDGQPGQWRTIAGSANFSNLALTSDEQMQVINGYPSTRGYMGNFGATWRQRSSGPPTLQNVDNGRLVPLPEHTIPWGTGIYKNLSEYGD